MRIAAATGVIATDMVGRNPAGASRNPRFLFSILTIQDDNDTTCHGAFQHIFSHDEDVTDIQGQGLTASFQSVQHLINN
jgi:hypothetical protein